MIKKYIIFGIIICVGFISHIFYEKNNLPCYIQLYKNIQGTSMEPLINSGEEIKLLTGYYNCHEIKRGDLIAYDFANTGNLYIKVLYGLPGDKLEIKDSQLVINGEFLTNSVGNIYKFNDAEIKLMSLYIVNGELKQGSYFIFGDNIGNSTDSRKFGAIGKKDIIGKFEYK